MRLNLPVWLTTSLLNFLTTRMSLDLDFARVWYISRSNDLSLSLSLCLCHKYSNDSDLFESMHNTLVERTSVYTSKLYSLVWIGLPHLFLLVPLQQNRNKFVTNSIDINNVLMKFKSIKIFPWITFLWMYTLRSIRSRKSSKQNQYKIITMNRLR